MSVYKVYSCCVHISSSHHALGSYILYVPSLVPMAAVHFGSYRHNIGQQLTITMIDRYFGIRPQFDQLGSVIFVSMANSHTPPKDILRPYYSHYANHL